MNRSARFRAAEILDVCFISKRFELGQQRVSVQQPIDSRLVSEEILVKRAYAQRPERFDYLLTAKGWQLCDILLAISAWGDQWTTSEAGPPALIRHRQCDHLTVAEIRCSHCREPLHAADTVVTPLR